MFIRIPNTLKKFQATADINDLYEIRIYPLKKNRAIEMTRDLLAYYKLQITSDALDYLLNRIKWLTPFNLQIMVRELKDLARERDTGITKELIEDAFTQIPDHINFYYGSYHDRLMKIFTTQEVRYASEVLCMAAVDGNVSGGKAFDLAVKYELGDSYKDVLDTLKYSGYLSQNNQDLAFHFNNPILKIWWLKNVCN